MNNRNNILPIIILVCLLAAGVILLIKPTLWRSPSTTAPNGTAELPQPTQSASLTRQNIENDLDRALPKEPTKAKLFLFEKGCSNPDDDIIQSWVKATIDVLPVDASNVDRHAQYVRDETGKCKDYAWRLFNRHKTLPPRLTPMLIEGLSDREERYAAYCAQALRKVKPPAVDAVEPLLDILRKYRPTNPDSTPGHLAHSAVGSLRVIGHADSQLITVFTELIDYARQNEIPWMLERDIKATLAHLRGKIHNEQSARVLIDTLNNDDDYNARANAARSLGDFTSLADIVVPPLINHIGSKSSKVRLNVVHALAALIHQQPELISLALCGAIADDSVDIRVIASEALTANGQASQSAVDVLVKYLEHRDDDVRWRAVTALNDMRATPAEEALRNRLDDAHPGIRQTAKAVLDRFNTLDTTATPSKPQIESSTESNQTTDR